MTLYSVSAVDDLTARYFERGGNVIQVREGVLGCGDLILYGEGLKTAVICEVYLNSWSSAHTIRMYKKTPAKYAAIIEREAA